MIALPFTSAAIFSNIKSYIITASRYAFKVDDNNNYKQDYIYRLYIFGLVFKHSLLFLGSGTYIIAKTVFSLAVLTLLFMKVPRI